MVGYTFEREVRSAGLIDSERRYEGRHFTLVLFLEGVLLWRQIILGMISVGLVLGSGHKCHYRSFSHFFPPSKSQKPQSEGLTKMSGLFSATAWFLIQVLYYFDFK